MRLEQGLLIILLAFFVPRAAAEDRLAERFRAEVQPILVERCHDCHGGGTRKGEVTLDAPEMALLADQDLWWRVMKNVRAGIMPPAHKERPTAEEVRVLEDWIKRDVFRIDPDNPDPGRVTIRRLNRVEYRNTIRDLMGVDFNTEEEFPPDDTGYGFDTIGDVLSTSPLLLEKYLHAAEAIVRSAVPRVSRVMPERTIAGDDLRSAGGDRQGSRLSFYEKASVGHAFSAGEPGDYRLILAFDVDGEFDFDPGRCRLTLLVDDKEQLEKEIGWHNSKRFEHEVTGAWPAGEHRLEIRLEPLTPPEKRRNSLFLRIASVRIQGPLGERHWTRPRNHERFFPRAEPPGTPEERRAYAREVLDRFATRAFRRPADAAVVSRLVAMAEEVFGQPGKRFEDGIAKAMVAVLASPRFIFRVEGAAQDPGGSPHPLVDEHALASRLSYFLWSTLPDEELMDLAGRGQLRSNLAVQVKRLLADSRAGDFARNFTGQWLQARDIDGISINARAILRRENIRSRIELDRDLRRAMRQETELFFESIVREDRSVLDLIDSDYTFLNEKLAKHYGISGVEGREMRRVALPAGDPRGGILTQGTVLVVTSNPTRTSPVKRGLFILENVLGTPPPPPPADVPELEAAEKEFPDREPSLRELMEAHRANALCRSCHSRMDPLGLALENFNALGLYREAERGQPIDTSGRLISGEKFDGARDLKRLLRNERRLDFYRSLTEKLLTYALGRGIERTDVEAIDRIVERLEKENGRFSVLLMGVIESAPFQRVRNPLAPPPPATNRPAPPATNRPAPPATNRPAPPQPAAPGSTPRRVRV
jgi:hypothetical protein